MLSHVVNGISFSSGFLTDLLIMRSNPFQVDLEREIVDLLSAVTLWKGGHSVVDRKICFEHSFPTDGKILSLLKAQRNGLDSDIDCVIVG